jgi:hypothetical protein
VVSSPRFSLDDFKRMFRVSRVLYNGIISILCAVDPFSRYGFNVTKSFNDGFDVTKKKKNINGCKDYDCNQSNSIWLMH